LTLAVLTAPGIARAGHEASLRGALVGAAAGLIVAHHGHVSEAIAVPAGALVGGLIANNSDHFTDDLHHDDWYPRGDDSYYDRHDRDSWRHRRQPRQVIVVKQAPKPKRVEAPEPPDLHPGVDLIKVSITLSNGTSVDIPVLRLGDAKFVGPQGEEYTALPTAKQLEEKYAK